MLGFPGLKNPYPVARTLVFLDFSSYALFLKEIQTYSAFANSCPMQTDTFLFPLIHSHNVILSSNKF